MRPPRSAAPRGSRPRPTAIQAAPDGGGYLVTSADGGAFAFGTAQFHGSVAGARLNGPIVDAAMTASGDGYWMLGRDGGVFGFPGPGLPPGGTPHLTVTPILSGLEHPVGSRIPPRRLAAVTPNARARCARS